MQILNISKRRFEKLEPLNLPREVFNTEAQMFIVPGKNKWDKKKSVLKKLYVGSGEVFSNKLYTISELINHTDEIGIEELVMPEALGAIDGSIVGPVSPYIPNINFQQILESDEYTNEQKMAYLKEIGELLEKLRKVRKYTSVKDFYLNDIHENNFILNTQTGRINAVDLDSAKIGRNLTAAARYLTPVSQLPLIPKYVPLIHSVGGSYEVTENTEIYCYVIMIFKLLYGDNISKISIPDFYAYLEYLSKIGVPMDFLDKVVCIYTGSNNENPYEYLEDLAQFCGRAHKNVFERVRQK